MTYWCQGKHKCEFQTSVLEAAALYKEYFIPGVSDIKNDGEAKLICQRYGGRLALFKRDWEVKKVKKLIQQKSIVTKNIRNFLIHKNTTEYFDVSSDKNVQNVGIENDCVVVQREVLLQTEFTVNYSNYLVLLFYFINVITVKPV